MNIGYLLFPGITQLDLTGPLQVLSRMPDSTNHLVARSLHAVATDCVSLLPTVAFNECPPLDVLIVPGGAGILEAIADNPTLTFIRSRAERARIVASVCTGAFLLGAAGLLRGKRATTHWAYHELLVEVGAIPDNARVVIDHTILTCAGVAAGLDGALSLITQLSGAQVARSVQLALEYDPAPPFRSGSPEKADPEVLRRVRAGYAPRLQALRRVLRYALHATTTGEKTQ